MERFPVWPTQEHPPSERVFFLHKAVIDEVAESHPGKKVLLMCYAPTAWPSKKIDYFGDNVIGELMNQEPEFLEAWGGKLTGVSGHVYWFLNELPIGFDIHATPREVAGKVRYLHEHKFLGLYQFAESNWGLEGPAIYVLGRMMGDLALDHRAIVQEYCHGVFGKAGATMLQFFDLFNERHKLVLPWTWGTSKAGTTRYPPGSRRLSYTS